MTIEQRQIIAKHLSVAELLTGLAEEASELAQAALKLRRSLTQVNPTPVTDDEAFEKLYEEAGDVELYMDAMSLNRKYIGELMESKLDRWIGRLEG